MALYIIGDVQGCFDELQTLLNFVQFNEKEDSLWFTGDLVNRGPKALETLRFIKSLGNDVKTVLGNHDFYFLRVAYQLETTEDAGILAFLQAKDKQELVEWMRHRPLMHIDARYHCILVHAGICPLWDRKEALLYAKEVETVLQSDQYEELLKRLYNTAPLCWSDDLTGWDRLLCIINYFTRMRYCDTQGTLDLIEKGSRAPEGYMPWYNAPHKKIDDMIAFGHWASLINQHEQREVRKGVFALDTGCVWGKRLSALRLDNKKAGNERQLVSVKGYQGSIHRYDIV